MAALPLGDGKTKTWVCRTEEDAEAKLLEGLEQFGQGSRLDTRHMTLGE